MASSEKLSTPSEILSMTASSGMVDPQRGDERREAERERDRDADRAQQREDCEQG